MSSPTVRKEKVTAKKPNRQQVAAAATRREILLTARRLFGARGYARTSIAEIADEAGVSIPTIYASVGPKPAIAMALVALIDQEISRQGARELLESTMDATELFALGARVGRTLQETFGDIIGSLASAAAVEPVVEEAVARGRRLHRIAATRMAERLAELGGLRQGVPVGEAADVIDLLTDASCYAKLVTDYGWTFDRAQSWIAATLRAILQEPR